VRASLEKPGGTRTVTPLVRTSSNEAGVAGTDPGSADRAVTSTHARVTTLLSP